MTVRHSTGIRAYWPVKCLGRSGHCDISLIRGAARDGEAKRWGWDGQDPPTITPSFNCQKCGLHVTITAGVETPART